MSKYEELKAKQEAAREAVMETWLNAGESKQPEDGKEVDSLRIAEKNLDAYKCKAADMHEELVEALENMMEWCAEYWDKDSIQELIERAKAL